MAVTLKADVILPCKNGITRDEAMNTFVFHTDGADTPTAYATALVPFLIDFYNTGVGGGDPIAKYLSPSRSRVTEACSIRWYDITAHLGGSAAGPPIEVDLWTLGGTTGDHLPEEVAVAMSFHADLTGITEFGPGTRPASRRRGRIFLGPLTDAIVGTDSDDLTLVQSFFRDLVVAAGERMRDADLGWSVWSRTAAQTHVVVGGWVDNAFDTIRGRGPRPSSKTFFAPPV